VHCDPDILLIDEILAVGDVGFRVKCYNKIAELKKTCAIILVSHNMSAIFRTTNRCIVMNKGKELFAGPTDKAIQTYNSLFKNRDVERNKGEEGEVELDTLLLYEAGGKSNVEFMHGVPLTIEMVVSIPARYRSIDVSIAFINYKEEYVAQCHSRYNRFTVQNNDRKEIIKTTIPQLILNPGDYTLTVIFSDTKTDRYLGWYQKLSPLKVNGNFFGGTNVQFLGKWEQIPYQKNGSKHPDACC
ncbi:MAG: hypothetical protein GY757_24930, partial [bacterium]|nr:hypothetical protein [bacterium]